MDALELLKQDHQKVKQLFEQCQTAKDKKQQKRFLKRSRPSWKHSDRRIRRVEGHGARVFGGAQAS
jgi:hypothetical protein